MTTGRLCSNLKDTGKMTDIIGYWLSGLIALGIIVIGARFFLAPHAAAVAFGVPLPPDPRWEAYLSVKAVRVVRDIASGFFIGILILNQAPTRPRMVHAGRDNHSSDGCWNRFGTRRDKGSTVSQPG